jgi:hypothetical protein
VKEEGNVWPGKKEILILTPGHSLSLLYKK